MVAYLNGSFIEEQEAHLQLSDLSIQRGYGIFDFFRTRNFVPLFIDDYLDRFYNSAHTLSLEPLPNRKAIKQIIQKLIEVNNLPDAGFRLILTGGYSHDSYHPASPNFIVLQQHISLPTLQMFETGLRLITHEYVRDLLTYSRVLLVRK